MMRLATILAAVVAVASIAGCGNSSKDSSDAIEPQKDSSDATEPQGDSFCCPGDVQYHGSIRVVLEYAGEVPLYDISLHLLHGGDNCETFDPENPWMSEGLGWKTAANTSDDVVWEGLQPGQDYHVTALAPGPADTVVAWACRDSIVVPADEVEVVEVTLELQFDVTALEAGCGQLSGDSCAVGEQCHVIAGWPQPEACLAWKNDAGAGEAQFVSCVPFESCGDALEWAHPADQPDELWLFQTTCIPHGWVAVDEAPCEPECPGMHPWLTEPQSWKCDLPDGTVCSWPAEGCEPVQKPDNVCICVEYGGKMRFECERPFHNCLPLEGADVPEGTLTRPVPKHREVAEVCESTLEPRADPTCTPSQPGGVDPESECTTDADCEGDGARCLDEWQGMGDTACTCHVPECFQDADCPGTAVCSCGKTENAESVHCEGPTGQSCLHECLFSDCRTDADCGEGKFCSASWDICGWQKVGYHCHDPEIAECFSNWECMGAEHWGCNFENGKGWGCQERPLCD